MLVLHGWLINSIRPFFYATHALSKITGAFILGVQGYKHTWGNLIVLCIMFSCFLCSFTARLLLWSIILFLSHNFLWLLNDYVLVIQHLSFWMPLLGIESSWSCHFVVSLTPLFLSSGVVVTPVLSWWDLFHHANDSGMWKVWHDGGALLQRATEVLLFSSVI